MTHFTLEEIRQFENGHLLDQIDCDFANEQLACGEHYQTVLNRIHGWASDYAFTAYCDAKSADDFEDRAYGRSAS